MRRLPAATQHKNVGTAVVIVVGLDYVQPAQLVRQAGLGGLLGKNAVSIVVEELHRRARVEARLDHVQAAVVLEVIHNNPPGHRERVKPSGGRDIRKAPNVFRRLKNRRRNQIFRRNFVWVLSQRHVCEVK